VALGRASRPRPLALAPGWLLAALLYAALSAVAIAAAADRRAAWTTWLEQASFLLAGWTAAQCFSRGRQRRCLLRCLVGLGAALAAHALWDYAAVLLPLAREYARNPDAAAAAAFGLPADAPPALLVAARVRACAATGFQTTSNLFAALLLPWLGAAAALATQRIHPDSRGERRLATGALVLMLAALLCSGARGAWLALAAAAGLLTLQRTLWPRLRPAARRHAATAAVAMGLLLLLWGVCHGLAHQRFPDRSLTVRWLYAAGSLRLVMQQPLLGVGPGNFGPAYAAVRAAAGEETVRQPHNFVWQAWAETGLPAGSLYITLVLAAATASWRLARRTPAAAPPRLGWLAAGIVAALLYALIENGLSVPGPALLFWVVAGAAAAPAASRRHVPRPFWAVGALLLLLAATAASLWLLPPVTRRAARLTRAAADLRAGDVPAALVAVRAAVDADPLDPVAPAELARLLIWSCPRTRDREMRLQLLAARQAAVLARARSPAHPGSHLLLARAHWYLADPDELAWAWRRQGGDLRRRALATRRRPTPDVTDLTWCGAAAFVDGDYPGAAAFARQAVALVPGSAVLQANLGDAAWHCADFAEARQAWRAAAACRQPNRHWTAAGEDLNAAVVRNPHDFRLRLELARFECLRGRPAAARAALTAARLSVDALNADSLRRPTAGERAEWTMLLGRAAALAAAVPGAETPAAADGAGR
jgi:hypothetical protein